tara:strand:+ start:1266 stop:2573 length:1308 start_codon:yes stop_codon:yes gene_type:complete
MQPSARAQATLELLNSIWTGRLPADQTISAYFRKRRYAGAKDRTQIIEQVYKVLRNRGRLQCCLASSIDGISGMPFCRAMYIAFQRVIEGSSQSDIQALFDPSGYGPSALSSNEIQLLVMLRDTNETLPVWARCNYPIWLEEHIKTRFRDNYEAELEAFSKRAPLDLRVNTLRCSRDRIVDDFKTDNIGVVPTPWSRVGLRASSFHQMRSIGAFQEGRIEIQDESSQVAAMLVDARPGMQVVDYCAGTGGKSLAMAATMLDRGQIYACDSDQRRLALARPRLSRAGVRAVQLHHLTMTNDPWLQPLESVADRVLVDAPCTGSGTSRRNPDLFWKLQEVEILRYQSIQIRLLNNASSLVRQGGRLIYVTCSFFCDENEAVVSQFLKLKPEFRVVPVYNVWSNMLDGPCPALGDYLLLSPARHNTDAVFVAILERCI